MKNNTYWVLFISCSTLVAGFLSYLYHPVMIRLLSIEDFGTFESVLSIMSILWVFSNALWLFYVKEVSRNIDNKGYSLAFRNITLRYIFFFGIWISFLFLLAIPFLANYLNIKFYYLLPINITILFSFLAVTNNAYLQSLKKFTSIASIITSASLLKLVSWFWFVLIGFGIFWALWGFIASQVFTFILGFTIIKKYFSWTKEDKINKQDILINSFLLQKKQILQYLFTSILIALLMNIDILIVKNMFGWETTGYYAAVSVLAKFLIFLWLSIETVYYPQMVKLKVFPTKQILKISAYYILMLLWALGFFYLFGEIILKLFKDGLQEYVWLIFPLLIYCGVLWYTSIIVKTLIAFEKYLINYIISILVGAIIIVIYMFASDIYSLAYIFMYGSIAALISALWTLLIQRNKGE